MAVRRIPNQRTECDFSRTVFEREARFDNVENAPALTFTECVFARAPSFGGGKIPKRCTFYRSRFLASALRPEDGGTYRSIRNLFHSERARDWEGYFYAKEKRCHRRSLSWRTDFLTRTVSTLYDFVSEYGQSYGRALGMFALVQIACRRDLWICVPVRASVPRLSKPRCIYARSSCKAV